MKVLKAPPPPPVSSYHNRLPQNSAMNFNQALTAEIIQTLSHESGSSNLYGLAKSYDLPPSSQYESPPPVHNMENREVSSPTTDESSYQSSSGLNTLSLICHAVYLDHNYNATMPPDSPTRNSPPTNTSPQINGLPGSLLYSPGTSSKSKYVDTIRRGLHYRPKFFLFNIKMIFFSQLNFKNLRENVSYKNLKYEHSCTGFCYFLK